MSFAFARSRLSPRRVEVLVPLAIYLMLVLAGATWSSLGIDQLRQDPARPLGTTLGEPNGLRADEWLVQTPVELNVLSEGHSTHSGLAQDPDFMFQMPSGQVFESVMFADTLLLRVGPWLPDNQLFAAWRLLPLLLLALSLPALLQRMGATRPLAWLAFAMTLLAPATLWWSFTPVRILAYASFGSWLLTLAHDRWAPPDPRSGGRRERIASIALACAGGLVLARLATYYVPWSIALGLPLVAVTAVYLFVRSRRSAIAVLGIGAVFGAVMLGLVMWENLESIRANLQTLYPGERRASGAQMPPYHLFGAPGLPVMHGTEGPVVANASEISSAFLLCAVWALALRGHLRAEPDAARRAASFAMGSAVLLLTVWCSVNLAGFGEHVPVLNLLTAPRAAQVVGFLATMWLCLLLARSGRSPRTAFAAAVATAVATAYGVSSLQSALPQLTVTRMLVTSVTVGALVWLCTMRPGWWAVGAITATLLATGWWINPVQLGLGDLRASGAAGAARGLADKAEAQGTWVATDNPYVSAMFTANGVPQLGGYQATGPDVDAWEELDPERAHEEVWNRGASHLWLGFAPESGTTEFSNPSPDVIQLNLDPCKVPAGLPVGHVVSASELPGTCLTRESRFTWGGQKWNVYRVDTSSAG